MNQPVKYLWQQLLVDALAHVVAGNFTGALFGGLVGLYTNAPTLSPDTLLADLTEPTFPGYARVAQTWTPPYQQPDKSYATSGLLNLFQMADNTVPTVVNGAFVVDSAGTHLLWAEQFAAPVALPTSAQALLYAPQLAVGSNNWGSGTVVT